MTFAIVAAGVGVAGSIGGAEISANASKSAASAQVGAAQNATQVQQNEFNTVNAEQGPARNLGYGADTLLANLFGIGNPTAPGAGNAYNVGGGTGSPTSLTGASPGGAGAGTPNYSSFYNSPNYQFALTQGEQAINRGASARGGLYSTSTLLGLNNYAQGAASQQYQSYVQNLMGLAGQGQQATNATSNAAITTGNNISANALSAGNANASGILGAGGANASGVLGATNAFGAAIGGSNLFSGINGTTTGASIQNTVNNPAYSINQPIALPTIPNSGYSYIQQ